MRNRFKNIILFSALSLALFGASSCSSDETNLANIIIQDGIVGGKLSLDRTSYEVGDSATIKVEIDDGYQLDNVYLNGKVIEKPYTFTVNNLDNYVSADFSLITGKTSLSLSTPSYLVVGNEASVYPTVYGPSTLVSYESSEPTIATISKTGVITALKPGFTCIKATSAFDNSVSDEKLVFVAPTYVDEYIKNISKYDYSNGVQFAFTSNIKLGSLNLGNLEIDTYIDIKMPDYDSLTSFENILDSLNIHIQIDFSKIQESSLSSTIFQNIIGEVFSSYNGDISIDDIKAIKSLDVYLFGLDGFTFALTSYNQVNNISSSTESSLKYYKKVGFDEAFNWILSNFNIAGLIPGMGGNQVDLSSTATMLNLSFVYDDQNCSIKLSDSILALVNSYVKQLIESISPSGSTIVDLLPTEFSRIEAVFGKTNADFDKITFNFKTKLITEFTFLSSEFYKNSDLNPQYFQDLKDDLDNKLKIYDEIQSFNVLVNDVNDLYNVLGSDFAAINSSLYNQKLTSLYDSYFNLSVEAKNSIDLSLIDNPISKLSILENGNNIEFYRYDNFINAELNKDVTYLYEETVIGLNDEDITYSLKSDSDILTIDESNKTIKVVNPGTYNLTLKATTSDGINIKDENIRVIVR